MGNMPKGYKAILNGIDITLTRRVTKENAMRAKHELNVIYKGDVWKWHFWHTGNGWFLENHEKTVRWIGDNWLDACSRIAVILENHGCTSDFVEQQTKALTDSKGEEMYYEEMIVYGVLCHRGAPNAEWIRFTAKQITARLMEVQLEVNGLYDKMGLSEYPETPTTRP